MSLWRKFLYGGLILSVGQVLSQGMSVIRNILVGRLTATEADFGIASTLIMVVSFSEMLTNLGTHTLVIQDPNGDTEEFLRVTHFVAVARGVVGMVMSVVLAYPVAFMFGIPDATWAFAALGLVPLARGFMHFDIYRLQREHSFLPTVFQESIGQVLTLIVCVPFLRYFHDYSAVLYLLIFQTAAMSVMSHVFARRPYRWSRNRVFEKRALTFGIPLMLNGLVFFVISQGERIAIGSSSQLFSSSHYTMEDMAAFSAAMMVASLATQFFARILGSLFMPLLARDGGQRFIEYSAICTQAHAFGGAMLAIPLIIYSDLILHTVWGDRYTSAGIIVVGVACVQGLLTMRCGVNVALMSKGFTWEPFINNLWRSAAFLGSFGIAAAGCSVEWIATPAIAGELIAIILVSRQLLKRCAIPLQDVLLPLGLLTAGLFVASLFRLVCYQTHSITYISLGLTIWIGFAVVWVAMFAQTSRLLGNFLLHFIRRPSHEGSA